MARRMKTYATAAEHTKQADPILEQEAREWLQAIVGEPFPDGVFHEALKDGVYMCKAINVLDPKGMIKINSSKTAFEMLRNIDNFLEACERFGVPRTEQFLAVDLYEGQNLAQVVSCIHALGKKAQSKPGYDGPIIGSVKPDEQERFEKNIFFLLVRSTDK